VVQSRGIYDAVDTDFLVDILNLPWFSRTWTVQKLVLARKAFVLCGTKSLLWESFDEHVWGLQAYERFLAPKHDPENTSNPAMFHDYL
jgi:hypothetical protein